MANGTIKKSFYPDRYYSNSLSSISVDVSKGAYLIFTAGGGASGTYNGSWIALKNQSNHVDCIQLYKGSGTINVSASGDTITISCPSTTISMGYVKLD